MHPTNRGSRLLDSVWPFFQDRRPGAAVPIVRSMILAFTTDDRTLHVFPNEAEATAYAEGIDVEDGLWLFFSQDGGPLEAVFTTPNKRGWLTVGSGAYRLQRASSKQGAHLTDLLPRVEAVAGELSSVEPVRELLTKSLHSPRR